MDVHGIMERLNKSCSSIFEHDLFYEEKISDRKS